MDSRNHLVKIPSDARTVLSTFLAIRQAASAGTPSVMENPRLLEAAHSRQLKVLKSSSLYGGKCASPQLPPTDLGSALGGHKKQMCIKLRTSTNCVVLTVSTVTFKEGRQR